MTQAADVVGRIVAGFLRRTTSPKEKIGGIIATPATAVLKQLRKPAISRTRAAVGVYQIDANFLHRTTSPKEDTCATVVAVTTAENCKIKRSE